MRKNIIQKISIFTILLIISIQLVLGAFTIKENENGDMGFYIDGTQKAFLNSTTFNFTGNIYSTNFYSGGGILNLSNYLPYSGATTNLNLGSKNITTTGILTANKIKGTIITGTSATAGSTIAKTVTIAGYTLEAGDILAITFTNGNSVAMTLNVNGGGAKNIYLGNTLISATTGTISAGGIMHLYYDGTDFRMFGSHRQSDSTATSTVNYGANWIAGETITRYKTVMEGKDGRFYSLVVGDSTGATKTVSTKEFKVDGMVGTFVSSGSINENVVSSAFYDTYMLSTTYVSYGFNGITHLTNNTLMFLKGTINNDGYFVLDNSSYTSWITSTLPTTEDGFVYVQIGTKSTTTVFIHPHHKIYEYKNGAVREYSSFEAGGNVSSSTTSTNNAIPRFDGTTGLLLQNSGITIDDSNNINISGNLYVYNDLILPTTNYNLIIGNQQSDGTGTTYFYPDSISIEKSDSFGAWLNIYNSTSGNNWYVGMSPNDDYFRIDSQSDWSGKEFIIDSGKIGIGTTPVNTLDVEGSMVIGSGLAGTTTAPANSLMVEEEIYSKDIPVYHRQYWFDEFLRRPITTFTPQMWVGTAGGSATVVAMTPSKERPGVTSFKSSTNANSYYNFYTNEFPLLLSGGEKTRFIFSPRSTISNTTMRLGFFDTLPNVAVVDGAYIKIYNGVMTGETANNSVTSTTSTNYTISNTTWYNGYVTVNDDGTSVLFELYASPAGSLLWNATLTTNIPTTSSRETGHGLSAMYSVASSIDLLYIDFMDLEIDRVLDR
jgi:hypothetical protein